MWRPTSFRRVSAAGGPTKSLSRPLQADHLTNDTSQCPNNARAISYSVPAPFADDPGQCSRATAWGPATTDVAAYRAHMYRHTFQGRCRSVRIESTSPRVGELFDHMQQTAWEPPGHRGRRCEVGVLEHSCGGVGCRRAMRARRSSDRGQTTRAAVAS